jgi:hypothetical protein
MNKKELSTNVQVDTGIDDLVCFKSSDTSKKETIMSDDLGNKNVIMTESVAEIGNNASPPLESILVILLIFLGVGPLVGGHFLHLIIDTAYIYLIGFPFALCAGVLFSIFYYRMEYISQKNRNTSFCYALIGGFVGFISSFLYPLFGFVFTFEPELLIVFVFIMFSSILGGIVSGGLAAVVLSSHNKSTKL